MKDFFLTFKYSFDSGTGPMEGYRYVRNIQMEIFLNNYEDLDEQSNKLIGKVSFKIIYIDQAINYGYDLYEIFDSEEYTFHHAMSFFDFKKGEIKEGIQKFYNYDIVQSNICILERIEILPEYRGYKIAAKATKDIIFHFESSCGLFIIQAFPLQFESRSGIENDWQKQLELRSFTSEETEAFKKLKKYYQSFGFDEIPRYKDLLFYNPNLKNDRIEAIDLED